MKSYLAPNYLTSALQIFAPQEYFFSNATALPQGAPQEYFLSNATALPQGAIACYYEDSRLKSEHFRSHSTSSRI